MSLRRTSARLVLGLAAICLTMVAATEVWAQDVWPYRIGVLGPRRVYTDPTLDADEVRTPNLAYGALSGEIFRLLNQDYRFQAMPENDLREAGLRAVVLHQDTLGLADSLRGDGIEQFGEYELDSAIYSLRSALERYAAAQASQTDPEAVALAHMYLARALLEQANSDEENRDYLSMLARENFEEMIRLDSNLNFRAGLYPEHVVALFRQAYLALLENNGMRLGLHTSVAETHVNRHMLDYLVYPYIIRTGGGIQLVVQVFDVETGSFDVFWEVIELTSETRTSIERVNRLISRFVACVPVRRNPPPPVVGGDAQHLFLQAGWSAAAYGSKPTAEQFLNQGIVLSLDYHFTDNFAVLARATMLFGSRDPAGNLLDGFNSIRSALGVAFSFRFGLLRLSLATGIELNRVSGFEATDEFWCKVSDGELGTFGSSDCIDEELSTQPPGLLVGPFIMPGFSFEIFSPFSLFLNGTFAFYLSDSDTEIDFPLGGEVGIEYRF